jgi:hypothetical protein
MVFCVCIVFSRIGERIDQTLTSVFEQEFPGLRLFLLDNAYRDFDHAGLEKFINQHKTGNNVNIIISRNSRRANGLEVFKQCAEAAEGCDFTILCPDEMFANQTILSQAYIQLQKTLLFYVKCGDETIPFFSKDFNMSLRLDPEIVSVKHALNKARGSVFLLDKSDWISREALILKYSQYIKLVSILNGLINLNFIKYNLHIFEREIQLEISDVLNRSKGCQWDIPENERAYILFLQQILEILLEADAKGRWRYSELKKDMKALLERVKTVRHTLDKTGNNALLLDNLDFISPETLKLNYSRYIKLVSILNGLINLNFIKYNLHIFEREIQLEISDVLIRPKESLWDIPESERAYMFFLQQILEILLEADTKGRWKYSELKKDLKALLEQVKTVSESKLKIVFFAQEYSVWPSLQSFYDACNKDERFIAQLIYIPFGHQNYNEGHQVPHEEMGPYWKTGYPIMPYTMYDLSKESPDIAVFVKPYDLIPMQFYIYDIDKVVRRCVYIRYGFEIAAWNLDYHFKLPLQNMAWKFIVYGDMVKELAKKVCYNQRKNVVAWGHPRADYYSNLEENRDNIPEEWKIKINGRKTVLWNTQHTLKEGPGAGTFFIWKEEVFSYFENHSDMVLLWRPHPLMFGALVNGGLMTESDLNNLIEAVEKKNNVILDRSPDYRNSFFASDAIITDGTAFLIEYLYTGRPLIFTIKESGGGIYFYDEICGNVCVAREKGDIIKSLNDIRKGIDPLKEKRLSLAKRLLKVNPGGNGEYIKDQIFSDLTKECCFEI